VDRLIVPGRQCALAPSYLDRAPGACCVSGTLWHAAFGTPGSPIFRQPDFEGAPSIEGYLSTAGIFVDAGRPFPGRALVVLSRRPGHPDEALGLYPVRENKTAAWRNDDTVKALATICDFYNDDWNTQAWRISECAPATASRLQ
jgi:hypothetical protein